MMTSSQQTGHWKTLQDWDNNNDTKILGWGGAEYCQMEAVQITWICD